ncbi:DUF58 domain-containing protein [Bacillus alkalicola]|uniref:DUF58 domain-containing protein n=2 Tax=Bacillaceae TaxID=186817 RepID=A0ABS6K238_9BACI|nr:DUF58 domain-containing protein [Bacillus alkalicola]MBU9723600.1 DUF58 domain-containing protein [Bacillus alkalicola]
MFQQIKDRWLPENQLPVFIGVIITWLSSLLFLLFAGGKLALVMFVIMTIISTYLLLLTRWSGIKEIIGKRSVSYRKREGRLEAGDSFQMVVAFKLPGFWPIPYVFIKEHFSHNRLGEIVRESSFVPDFYRNGEINYTIPDLERGVYSYTTTECSTVDLLNFFEHNKTIHLPFSFKVFPKTIRIKEWSYINSNKKAAIQHVFHHNQRETQEVDGVREYRMGDRLSRIHWNATARTGTWKSKEFIKESVPKVLIVLDQYKGAYHNRGQFELAVSITASIIQYVMKEKIPIGSLFAGINYQYMEPKSGMAYVRKIEDRLLHVECNGERTVDDVLLHDGLNNFRGSIVVISPLTSDQLFQRFKWLKKRGMKTFHLLIGGKTKWELDRWEQLLQSESIDLSYIESLGQLPVVLERGMTR